MSDGKMFFLRSETMSDLSSSDDEMFFLPSEKMSGLSSSDDEKFFLRCEKMLNTPDVKKKEMFLSGFDKINVQNIEIFRNYPRSISNIPYFMSQGYPIGLSEKHEDICRTLQIEVPKSYCKHYSEAVMEFFQIERNIELAIIDNGPLEHDYFIQLKSLFDCPLQKGLASFEEEFKLLKVKYIFHFEKCDSRFDECQRILRDVDLDEHDLISRRLNLHRAECSLIKAIIIKRKSGSYSPGSECSKLMEFIAQSKFGIAYNRCVMLLDDCPNGGRDYLKSRYYNYLNLLRPHLEADYHSMPYKMKNANSYHTLDELMKKAHCNRTRELSYVKCCIESDMPGNKRKWIDLLWDIGAKVLDNRYHKKGEDEIFYVSRDRDRHSIDRTARDLMDTTITVIIDDLM